MNKFSLNLHYMLPSSLSLPHFPTRLLLVTLLVSFFLSHLQPLSSQLSLLAKLQIAVGSGIDCLVGPGVGRAVGLGVGSGVGSGVGFGVLGSGVGTGVGSGVGTSVGSVVGSRVGSGVGSAVGSGVGSGVGDRVGSGVGSGVSSGVGNDVGSGVFWRWSRCCLWSRFRRCLQGRRCFSGNIRFWSCRYFKRSLRFGNIIASRIRGDFRR